MKKKFPATQQYVDNWTADDSVTISLSQQEIDALQSSLTTTMASTSTSTWNSQYTTLTAGAVGSSTTAASSYTIGTNSNWNGTFTLSQPKLSIEADNEKVIFKTVEHTIDWDEFVNDVHMIKRAFMTMSNNDDLMEKYPEIRDMLAEWMLRGLSK